MEKESHFFLVSTFCGDEMWYERTNSRKTVRRTVLWIMQVAEKEKHPNLRITLAVIGAVFASTHAWLRKV